LVKGSQIEGKLVKVNTVRNVADLTTIDSDLISQHTRGGDLDGIGPVVVVVAESVGEVENGILGDVRCVLCYVEMGWLNSTLGDRVRNEEEIEASINDLCLLDETVVHISTLRRVQDVGGVRAWVFGSLLEESLSHTLVDDHECGVRKSVALILGVVLVLEDLLELVELELDDLCAHGVTNTVTIDEDVIGQVSLVV